MQRNYRYDVYLSSQEKRIIEKNAALNNYKSVSAFLRDMGLSTDISNKTVLTVLLTYFKIHLQNYSPDKALDWTKQKTIIKKRLSAELAGYDKPQREKYLKKIEETVDHALEIKKELEDILLLRKQRIENEVY